MNKFLKRSSIVIASLALITPLAMNNNLSAVSAKTRPYRTAVVSKRIHHTKRTQHKQYRFARKAIHKFHRVHSHKILHHRKHAHHYYKFAYSKHEYKAYLSAVRQNQRIDRRIEKQLNYKHHNYLYRHGVRDALADVFNSHLRNNRHYKSGYIHALTLDNLGKITKTNLNYASRVTYHEIERNGTNGYYINLLKSSAHHNML